MERRTISPKDREIITEIYHKYPEKEVTMQMLIEAHKATHLEFGDIKKVFNEYISLLNTDMNA